MFLVSGITAYTLLLVGLTSNSLTVPLVGIGSTVIFCLIQFIAKISFESELAM